MDEQGKETGLSLWDRLRGKTVAMVAEERLERAIESLPAKEEIRMNSQYPGRS